MTQIIGPV